MLVDHGRGQECLARLKIKINPSNDEQIVPESWYVQFQIKRSFWCSSFKQLLCDSSRVSKAVLFGNSFKVHVCRWMECLRVTVFPVKPWTPGKISGMFIVSRPIRCEMKPQKITDKPQNGLFTTWHETTSSLFLPRGIFNFAVFKYWSFSFSIAALLSPKNRYERHFTKSEVNQEDRIRHS